MSQLGLDDVVDHFTLVGDELDLLRNKSGATRLGFAILLKFLLWRGRFPSGHDELADDAVAHLARQVRVPAGELASFDFASRTAQRHRTEIRVYSGFRECSVADAEALSAWLAEHVASGERRPERVRDALIRRCRAELIEPPTTDRVSEIVRSGLYQAEQALLALIADRVDPAVMARLEALIATSDDDEENVLGLIKTAPGNVSLETMLVEISKLEAIRAIGLPADLFNGVDAKVIAGWRARAAVESPSHLREHPQPTKLALLCALLYLREREVTDALAQLLIATVHRINAHAEEKVITALVKDFKRVTGKETLLRKIAEASLGTPDDTVREVIFPVVGGEATLQDLVAEYRQTGTEYATAIRGRHRLHRGNPAALHPQRVAPRLPSDARTRTSPEDDLRRPLPPRSRPAARDQRGPQPDRGMEPRQRRHLLRQSRRVRHQPTRPARTRDARPPHPPSRPWSTSIR